MSNLSRGTDLKKHIEDMALFGGESIFDNARPTGQLSSGDISEFIRHSEKIFRNRRFSNNGPIIRELESRLEDLHSSRYCITYCNAFCALIVLLSNFKLTGRIEAIIPSFTYRGLPHMCQWAGLKVRFADVDSATHVLDPDAVSRCISNKTAIILGVHHVNSPCPVERITKIARQADIPLIYDSVYGQANYYKGKPLGTFGMAEVFSLHATKLINGFEGGYITTNNSELAANVRLAARFGFDGKENIKCLGMNGKLNEIHAAMALVSIQRLDETINANKRRYEAYHSYFKDIPGLSIVKFTGYDKVNYCLTLMELSQDWPYSHDDTLHILHAEKIYARPYYTPPLHLSEHAPEGCKTPSLPVSEELSHKIIQMPVGEKVKTSDIKRISEFFRFIFDNADKIKQRLYKMRAVS